MLESAIAINTISGGVAGFCVVAAGHPFDLVKMRLQTTSPGPHGVMGTLTSIIKKSGFKGLYQGASAPFMAVTPIFALNFYGYSLGQRIYRNFAKLPKDGEGVWRQYSYGALFSGLQTSLIVIPGDRIKVFMQRSGNEALGIGTAIKKIYSSSGFGGLFRGASLTMGRDLPGIVIFFTAYEQLRKVLLPQNGAPNYKFKESVSIIGSGGMAGMASWCFSLPFDVIKSRLQSMDTKELKVLTKSNPRFPSLVLLRKLLAEEGIRALYKGITPVMMRAFVANGACFLGYEFCRDLLKK